MVVQGAEFTERQHFPNAQLRVAVGDDGGTKRGLPSDFPNCLIRVVGGVDGG